MSEPTEKLFEEVLGDARTKADRAVRRARRDADEVRKKVADEAGAAAQAIRDAAQAEADQKRRQILATVNVEAHRLRLARIEESLDAVQAEARKALASLSGGELRQATVRLALDALAQMPAADRVIVALPAELHQQAGAQIVQQLSGEAAAKLGRPVEIRLDDRPAPIAGGVVLRSADGRVEIINSLEERLRRMWPELRLGVAATLFPADVKSKEK